MKRLLVAACLAVAGVGGTGLSTPGPALAASGGNADAAHACQQTGYLSLFRADGTGFQNAGECTAYAARGGQFSSGISSCSPDPGISGCVSVNNLTIAEQYTGLGTISLTGEFSFSPLTSCGAYTLPTVVPCGSAMGGGTYTVTGGTFNGGTGGTFTVTRMYGTFFSDSTGAQSTCADAGTGLQIIGVVVTFTDTGSGDQLTQYLFAVLGDTVDLDSAAAVASTDASGGTLYAQSYPSALPPGVTISC